MERRTTLALDVPAEPTQVFQILATTEGQQAFWTSDCEVTGSQARFSFPEVPVALETDVTSEPGRLVRMTVTSGFPYWVGSTWEWELSGPTRAPSGTGVLFRHYGFEAGYPESDLGHTAQTWALIMDRLGRYVRTGTPAPFFQALP